MAEEDKSKEAENLKLVHAVVMQMMAELQKEIGEGGVVLAGTMAALAEMYGLSFTDEEKMLSAWKDLCEIGREHAVNAFQLKARMLAIAKGRES